jgi:hypothetical protein
MVAALRAMRAAGTLKDADITVFLTGDEEDSGNPIVVARRDLIAAGKAADVALDFEGLSQEEGPNGLLDMGSVARRSSGSWTLTVQSKPAHSSGIFQEGVGFGAAYELARILDEFRRTLREDKLSYNVGLIGSGQTATLDEGKIRLEAAGKTNIVPGGRHCPRRPQSADPGPDRPHPGKDAGDRRQAAAWHHRQHHVRHRRLSADGAHRRQYGAADAAQCRQPRYGPARDGRARPGQARRRRHQLCRSRTSTGLLASVPPARAPIPTGRRSTFRPSGARPSAPPS